MYTVIKILENIFNLGKYYKNHLLSSLNFCIGEIKLGIVIGAIFRRRI